MASKTFCYNGIDYPIFGNSIYSNIKNGNHFVCSHNSSHHSYLLLKEYNYIIGKICFYGYWTYNIVLAKNRTVKDNLLSGHYFINGCKPQNAFKIKKGLGIYVPTIGINEVGQYFKKYRKL